ncbi:MAG TPA: helical backbone metal receptor [Salinimicrobium sp.]|nr:helical backbone metal receptor [Salinimicrobium sp.]
MKSHKDQLNRFFELEKVPQRIVSLVPSQTELLVDLGLRDKIVGVTKFCVHPHDLQKEKMVVGGTKTVHFDKIKKLNPDIVLCNKEENTKEMVLELEKIAPVHVSDVKNIDDTFDLIQQYGKIFQVEKNASKLIEKIKTAFSDFEKFIQQKESKSVAYFIWKDPWMLAGKNTFINYLLRMNRFENVFSNLENRYPEVNLSEIAEKNPQLILLSSEPFPFKEKHVIELQSKFPDSEVKTVDGEFFSWYGSRLLKAFDYFKTLHTN